MRSIFACACRLRAKPVRTASGIAVVAVMSKPHRCPHIATTGNICVYCPGGPDSDFEYSTQSYTGCAHDQCQALVTKTCKHRLACCQVCLGMGCSEMGPCARMKRVSLRERLGGC